MTPLETFNRLAFERDKAAYGIVGAARCVLNGMIITPAEALTEPFADYDRACKALDEYQASDEWKTQIGYEKEIA